MNHEIGGIYNVAGDGRVPWSEIASICGKTLVPMPPLLTEWAAAPLARLGVELPPELLDLFRYGRGIEPIDHRKRGLRSTRSSVMQPEQIERRPIDPRPICRWPCLPWRNRRGA